MLCVLLVAASVAQAAQTRPVERIRVMSLNMYVGGEGLNRPMEDFARVIHAAGADVVGLQEARGKEVDGVAPDRGSELAKLLGWHYLAQPDKRGILSRFPIIRATNGKQGALIRGAGDHAFFLFNVHLPAAPYQPYLLLGIEYGQKGVRLHTEAEAIRSAEQARSRQVQALIEDIKSEPESGRSLVFVTGDFNEPSYLDWSDAAARAGRCPIKVEYPSVRAVAELGFIDTFRAIYPDPVDKPGHTWTPTTRADDPKDRHDRIDFVMVRSPGAPGARVETSQVVGEKGPMTDLADDPWPSDHRAVLAEVRWTRQ